MQNSKIIYIDNPRVFGRSAITNKQTREESRKRLLTYLGTCQSNYYPEDLENLNKKIDDYTTREEELNKEIELKEARVRQERAKFQEEVDALKKEKEHDLKITGRNFERQIQELQVQSQKRLQATQQELGESHRMQLEGHKKSHEKAVEELRETCRNNLERIRNDCEYIRVGKAICRYGHDNNIQVYDRSGSLIPSHQSDLIGHIYCPTCGTIQRDWILSDARTITLEE